MNGNGIRMIERWVIVSLACSCLISEDWSARSEPSVTHQTSAAVRSVQLRLNNSTGYDLFTSESLTSIKNDFVLQTTCTCKLFLPFIYKPMAIKLSSDYFLRCAWLVDNLLVTAPAQLLLTGTACQLLGPLPLAHLVWTATVYSGPTSLRQLCQLQ